MRLEALDITDEILDKIESKHGVTLDEVEVCCFSASRHVRKGREGLFKVFSRTDAGRYLLIVLAESGGGVWRVVTAREMTATEKRLYRESTGA